MKRVTAEVPDLVYAALQEFADERAMHVSQYISSLLSHVVEMKATLHDMQGLTEDLRAQLETFDDLTSEVDVASKSS
jgi:hypothetical protein